MAVGDPPLWMQAVIIGVIIATKFTYRWYAKSSWPGNLRKEIELDNKHKL